MQLSHNRIILLVLMLAVAGLAVVYAVFDPADGGFFPRCMFKTLTGLDCPGCGSQRAVHALLNGDIAAAWHFNALFLLEIPLLALLIFTGLFPGRYPRLNRLLDSQGFILIILAVIVIFTILRNL